MSERTGTSKYSFEERIQLALALLKRPNRRADAEAEFTRCYPTATPPMIQTAVHHVYVDGPEAVIDWLADAELFLRDPEHQLCFGATWHLLYHVYNWHVFRELLPYGKEGMIERLDEIKEFIDEGSLESAKNSADTVKKMLDGQLNTPDFQ